MIWGIFKPTFLIDERVSLGSGKKEKEKKKRLTDFLRTDSFCPPLDEGESAPPGQEAMPRLRNAVDRLGSGPQRDCRSVPPSSEIPKGGEAIPEQHHC